MAVQLPVTARVPTELHIVKANHDHSESACALPLAAFSTGSESRDSESESESGMCFESEPARGGCPFEVGPVCTPYSELEAQVSGRVSGSRPARVRVRVNLKLRASHGASACRRLNLKPAGRRASSGAALARALAG